MRCASLRASTASSAAAPQRRLTSLPGEEFVKRLLSHVLASGFKRIRHYGLLAMPAAQPATQEDVAELMRRVAGIAIATCPHCHGGRWRVLEQRRPQPCPDLHATDERRWRACRGPPGKMLG